MCTEPLTEKETNLVLNNEKLIHLFLSRIRFDRNYYDDLFSVGKIGLVKAVKTFDESKNFAFSTYAYQFIKNEIFSFFRKEFRHINYIYLDSPISASDSEDLTLMDTIADPSPDFTETIADKDDLVNVVNIILNLFSPRERFILLDKLFAQTPKDDLLKVLKISRAYLFTLNQIISRKLLLYISTPPSYEGNYIMSYENGFYKFSLTLKDNALKLTKDFLINNSNDTAVNYEITNNTVIITLPATQESFKYIRDLFLELDRKYIEKSNKPISNISGLVTKYILSLDTFTANDIFEKFPNFQSGKIYDIIYNLKNKNLIIQISLGTYKVIK